MTLLIPQGFSDRIRRIFGEAGRRWLEDLPHILARCQERWQLTDLRPARDLSYNLVCFAQSPVYGAVALKVGVPNPELITERQALALYAGRGVCACYEADGELGALLLQRVEPGTDLREVADSEERFRIAARLFATLPVTVEGEHGFPTYAGWISRAFARARTEGRAPADLLTLVDVAERFFHDIDTPDRPHLLLHGDLHHKNILQDRQGGWTVIDPKGVIGVPAMGAARFMQNEFRMFRREDRFDRLGRMTAVFGEALGETPLVMARCALVEHVLATCWDAEENEEPESLRTTTEECAALLDYCLAPGGDGNAHGWVAVCM
jgi:streptomycin 6-kinase